MTDRVRERRDGKWFGRPTALQHGSGTAVAFGTLWADGIASAHLIEARSDMIVKQVTIAMEERDDLVSKEGAPRHPLEVGASAMVVGAIKAPTREGSLNPAECGFVSHVHPECHLSLAAIAAEMSLAHEESDQKSGGEVIRGRMSRRGVGFPMHGATVAQVVSP